MLKLTRLDNCDSSISRPVESFLNPDVVYVPITGKIARKKLLKKGCLLCKDQYVPVSGKLLNLEKVTLANGNMVNAVSILNDFQEKNEYLHGTRKRIQTLPKDVVLESIYDVDLKKKLIKENIETIVVSGIDEDPHILNTCFIGRNYAREILEMLDAFLSYFPGSKVLLAVKNTDSETILRYHDFLGTYQNIELCLVDDLYLIGREEYLTEVLHIQDHYLYFTIPEVYALYTFIKKRRVLTEKYITIMGDAVKNPGVFHVKLGTKINNILEHFYPEGFSDVDFYVNGIMQGKKMSMENLIVTKEFQGLSIMKKKDIVAKDCMRCGKCIRICPIHSNPLLAYKEGRKVKCIHCGLCSYVCPSYIPLQNYLGDDSNE